MHLCYFRRLARRIRLPRPARIRKHPGQTLSLFLPMIWAGVISVATVGPTTAPQISISWLPRGRSLQTLIPTSCGGLVVTSTNGMSKCCLAHQSKRAVQLIEITSADSPSLKSPGLPVRDLVIGYSPLLLVVHRRVGDLLALGISSGRGHSASLAVGGNDYATGQSYLVAFLCG